MKITKEEINEIIENEIIVDCYGDDEVNMGWAIFMEDNITYPFEAKYRVKKKTGKTSWEKIVVVNNESSESNFRGGNYYVEIEYNEIIFSVKLEELKDFRADDETLKALEIWNYRNRF